MGTFLYMCVIAVGVIFFNITLENLAMLSLIVGLLMIISALDDIKTALLHTRK